MFKVEANLKEIANRQLTQRRARKEGEPGGPSRRSIAKRCTDFSSGPRWRGIVLFPTRETKPVDMTPGLRRCDIFLPAS